MRSLRHTLAASALAFGCVLSACAHRTETRAEESAPPERGSRPAPPVEAAPTPVDPAEAEARAEAAFVALEPGFEVQRSIVFDSVQQLKAGLRAKTQGQARLAREYAAVARLGSPAWGAAAMVRLGMLSDDFAQTLRTAATPPGLTPEQESLYRAELENRAAPLDAQAAGAYQQALRVAGESGQASEWARFARERLEQLGATANGHVHP